MGAARWVVVGTALAVAATATYMLMSPGPQSSAGDAPGAVSTPSGTPGDAPQDQIDAESRDAMRDFLKQSVREKGQNAE